MLPKQRHYYLACCFVTTSTIISAFPSHPLREHNRTGRLRQYIEDYASCFQLGQHVRFGHFVTAVTPFYPDGDDDPNTLMWSVTFTSTRHEQPSTRCSSEASEDPGDAFHESSSGEHDVVQRTEIFDKCIIASGIFSEPNLPPASKVGGIAAAVEKGWATHGATYRDPGSYAGKAVLVVGCAFSGAEIACGKLTQSLFGVL